MLSTVLHLNIADRTLRQASVTESELRSRLNEGVFFLAARKIRIKVIVAPPTGHVLDAPPVLMASDHSIDYTCGKCGTTLLHAEEGQVHGVLIHCKSCGSYNVTEA